MGVSEKCAYRCYGSKLVATWGRGAFEVSLNDISFGQPTFLLKSHLAVSGDRSLHTVQADRREILTNKENDLLPQVVLELMIPPQTG
jgi:hypothetical protein